MSVDEIGHQLLDCLPGRGQGTVQKKCETVHPSGWTGFGYLINVQITGEGFFIVTESGRAIALMIGNKPMDKRFTGIQKMGFVVKDSSHELCLIKIKEASN